VCWVFLVNRRLTKTMFDRFAIYVNDDLNLPRAGGAGVESRKAIDLTQLEATLLQFDRVLGGLVDGGLWKKHAR